MKPLVSTANSGLSFGKAQNDVAVNPSAKNAFGTMLDNAVDDGRITQEEVTDWLDRTIAGKFNVIRIP